MADNDNEQGSPRYVDERSGANKNLRPNLEETQARETNKPPKPDDAVEEDDEDDEESGEEG